MRNLVVDVDQVKSMHLHITPVDNLQAPATTAHYSTLHRSNSGNPALHPWNSPHARQISAVFTGSLHHARSAVDKHHTRSITLLPLNCRYDGTACEEYFFHSTAYRLLLTLSSVLSAVLCCPLLGLAVSLESHLQFSSHVKARFRPAILV